MTLRGFIRLFPLGATLLSVYIAATGCSTVTIDNDSPPEAQYQEGERLLKKDRYIEAVERFRILKNRYPYSKYAALAALRIGDAHFQEEAYLEAGSAYKVFRELYPKHEEAPYAVFRIGESNYNLMPSTIDRDLDSAQSAIDAYSLVLKDYPSSKYAEESKKKLQELKGKLAEKEDYVANFYFKRELYQAAAGRYALLVERYPGFGYNREALFRLAFSYERMGEYRKASDTLDRLDGEFPDEKDSGKRKKLRKLIAAGLEKPE